MSGQFYLDPFFGLKFEISGPKVEPNRNFYAILEISEPQTTNI